MKQAAWPTRHDPVEIAVLDLLIVQVLLQAEGAAWLVPVNEACSLGTGNPLQHIASQELRVQSHGGRCSWFGHLLLLLCNMLLAQVRPEAMPLPTAK